MQLSKVEVSSRDNGRHAGAAVRTGHSDTVDDSFQNAGAGGDGFRDLRC
jgi:hypothetical protein